QGTNSSSNIYQVLLAETIVAYAVSLTTAAATKVIEVDLLRHCPGLSACIIHLSLSQTLLHLFSNRLRFAKRIATFPKSKIVLHIMEINLTEGGVLSIIKESPHNGLTLQLLNLSPLRSSFNSAIQHRVDLSDGNHIQPALLPSKFAGHVLDKILQEGSIVLLRKYVCRNYNKNL
ncbi:hypothetical protein KI387_033490, partial [Taxus chinensis]